MQESECEQRRAEPLVPARSSFWSRGTPGRFAWHSTNQVRAGELDARRSDEGWALEMTGGARNNPAVDHV